MKFSLIICSIIGCLTFIACDTEDARTPLGITITTSDVEIEVPENIETGTELTTVSAKASDDSNIIYEIESETAEGAVVLDEETPGLLLVSDASLFAYTLNTEINVTVNAILEDFTSVSEEILVTIFIEEVLDLTTDRDALLDIYNNNTSNTLDWDIESEDITTWTGVTVTDSRVTALDIANAGITTVPATIRRLSELQSLDLSNNSITTLTDNIAQLENLEFLDISNNSIDEDLSIIICEAFTFDGVNFIKDETAVCTLDNGEVDSETEDTDEDDNN